jgi:ribonuclease-3
LDNMDLDALEEHLGYHFGRRELLTRALTHSSFANELKLNYDGDYERMEFLGDAVLELVSSDYLYKKYPDKPEGELSRKRASMVCEPALAYCAREISLQDYIRLGRGEESTGGRNRDSITSDVLEAVIGGIYLDSGFEDAKEFVCRVIMNDLEDKRIFYDSKTMLQEKVQQKDSGDVHYEIIAESGPDHNKQFTAQVVIGGRRLSTGTGHNKKAAEQQAAYNELVSMKQD